MRTLIIAEGKHLCQPPSLACIRGLPTSPTQAPTKDKNQRSSCFNSPSSSFTSTTKETCSSSSSEWNMNFPSETKGEQEGDDMLGDENTSISELLNILENASCDLNAQLQIQPRQDSLTLMSKEKRNDILIKSKHNNNSKQNLSLHGMMRMQQSMPNLSYFLEDNDDKDINMGKNNNRDRNRALTNDSFDFSDVCWWAEEESDPTQPSQEKRVPIDHKQNQVKERLSSGPQSLSPKKMSNMRLLSKSEHGKRSTATSRRLSLSPTKSRSDHHKNNNKDSIVTKASNHSRSPLAKLHRSLGNLNYNHADDDGGGKVPLKQQSQHATQPAPLLPTAPPFSPQQRGTRETVAGKKKQVMTTAKRRSSPSGADVSSNKKSSASPSVSSSSENIAITNTPGNNSKQQQRKKSIKLSAKDLGIILNNKNKNPATSACTVTTSEAVMTSNTTTADVTTTCGILSPSQVDTETVQAAFKRWYSTNKPSSTSCKSPGGKRDRNTTASTASPQNDPRLDSSGHGRRSRSRTTKSASRSRNKMDTSQHQEEDELDLSARGSNHKPRRRSSKSQQRHRQNNASNSDDSPPKIYITSRVGRGNDNPEGSPTSTTTPVDRRSIMRRSRWNNNNHDDDAKTDDAEDDSPFILLTSKSDHCSSVNAASSDNSMLTRRSSCGDILLSPSNKSEHHQNYATPTTPTLRHSSSCKRNFLLEQKSPSHKRMPLSHEQGGGGSSDSQEGVHSNSTYHSPTKSSSKRNETTTDRLPTVDSPNTFVANPHQQQVPPPQDKNTNHGTNTNQREAPTRTISETAHDIGITTEQLQQLRAAGFQLTFEGAKNP